MKNTKLIIKFMGYRTYKPTIGKIIKPLEHTMVSTNRGQFEFEDLSERFKEDWEWIIRIVSRIYELSLSNSIINDEVENKFIKGNFIYCVMENNIAGAYDLCINFIDWYNDTQN